MKIISGGQTGADQGGLDAAIQLGIETGGWAPWNWKTERGYERNLLESYYHLKAAPHDSSIYKLRTKLNVKYSDVTIIFGYILSPGSRLTISYCNLLQKPFQQNPSFNNFLTMLESNEPKIINIAGNRESKNPGIHDYVMGFLVYCLEGTI